MRTFIISVLLYLGGVFWPHGHRVDIYTGILVFLTFVAGLIMAVAQDIKELTR